MKDNKLKTTETTNDQAIVSLNIPITTTEEKLKQVLDSFGFDAPLPLLSEVDQINLQITIESEVNNV